MTKTRYAQVGLGGRSWMYTSAIVETYAEHCELVGLCDPNPGRLDVRLRWVRARGGSPGSYASDAFEAMISECRPDVVIVTTVDQFHDEYICRAMEMGCDVITEKPMTTDAVKCQHIIDTQASTERVCRVTFNYRYSPPRTQVKHLLMSGVIGDILSVDFHWLLDTHHGADYFRRWHRNKVNSGGLMVHKATHHFDLVNWWLSDIPETVFAMGQRRFYTPHQADRYGLTSRGERCYGCPEARRCPYYLDLASTEKLRSLYLDQEAYDGYYRDRCVFSGLIDIEDSMNLVVSYRSGVKMSYSLNAFMPWEGYMIAFNGTRGRLEHKCEETVYISGDDSVPGQLLAEGTTIKVYPHFGTGYSVPIWRADGGHGGGDSPLLHDIFSPDAPVDKYKRAADHRSGAYSILTGVAANRSMATGQAIQISELVSGIGAPDYPAMPRPDDPIALPGSKSQRMSLDEAELQRGGGAA